MTDPNETYEITFIQNQNRNVPIVMQEINTQVIEQNIYKQREVDDMVLMLDDRVKNALVVAVNDNTESPK